MTRRTRGRRKASRRCSLAQSVSAVVFGVSATFEFLHGGQKCSGRSSVVEVEAGGVFMRSAKTILRADYCLQKSISFCLQREGIGGRTHRRESMGGGELLRNSDPSSGPQDLINPGNQAIRERLDEERIGQPRGDSRSRPCY